MAQRKTLNSTQVAVLRWVADGCPDRGVDSISTRISAGALRNRGLIRTSGHGPTWSASITVAGKDYLAQVDGSSPPQPRQPNISVTQQLVDDVVAAGGALRLPRKEWRDKDGIDWERRVRLAETHGKVPAGSRLRVGVLSPTELVIELVQDESMATAHEEDGGALAPIPVPARLRKYHPVASEFARRTDLHEVSRKTLPRVLRILHALASEAERRGHTVGCVGVGGRYGGEEWRPAREGELVFTIRGHDLRMRISEKGCGLRGPYEEQMKRWKLDREQPVRMMLFLQRPKPYDIGATGELNIALLGGSSRQTSWGDRSRLQVEDRLPNVLHELQLQAAEAEERRLAREAAEAERQRQWEAAVERARLRVVEEHQAETLTRRVRAWEEADKIRAYCEAVEARYGIEAVAANPSVAEWLAFARQRADLAQQLPEMPPNPEITRESLTPHLGGWSPYGPQR
jgi:hypothetical protein